MLTLIPSKPDKTLFSRAFLALLLFTASGCVLAPAIDSFKQLGATEGDRAELLPKTLKDFSTSLYWGKKASFDQFIVEENHEELSHDLKQRFSKRRVIETKVDDISFDEGNRSATVELLIKSFKVPVYIVEELRQVQKWSFTMSKGWQLASIESETAENA